MNEPSRQVPIIHEADVCVLGGSCTGLFAALRAARLGARVVIVEKDNCFGGVATTAMVNVWHSLWDTEGNKEIIAGLTAETMQRLHRRGVVKLWEKTNPHMAFTFNSEELKIELDEMAAEAGIKVYFHTVFAAPLVEDGKLSAVLVENKSGRSAIKARIFVDATGDGDLATRLGSPTYFANHLQPATTCARFSGWDSLGKTFYQDPIRENGERFGLKPGFAWGCRVPGSDTFMLAGTRIYGINPANADDLTRGEIEGRRQVRAIMDILKEAVPENKISLEALSSRIGLRESRHIRCGYQLTGDDVLEGRAFPDSIAQGSYRVDVHHQDKPGITFRYLDGREEYCRAGYATEKGRWRQETTENPTYYQIPYRSLLPQGGFENVIVAGRMLDVDPIAHAAVRVMVNMNQTGEAAGVAAWMALDQNTALPKIDPTALRRQLVQGGSSLI